MEPKKFGVYGFRKVQVERIVDADTIWVQWTESTNEGEVLFHSSIRFYGINCPEKNTPEGIKATEALSSLIHPGDKIRIECFGLGNFGRILAIPYANGINICKWLMDNNYADLY